MTSDTNTTPGEAVTGPDLESEQPSVQPDAASEQSAVPPEAQPAPPIEGQTAIEAQPAIEGPTAIEPQPAIEVQIDKWVYGGASLARANGKVLMIPFALPGERVRVEIVKDHGGFAEARVQEWLERSPERVEPQCPVFARCGGCHYQHGGAVPGGAQSGDHA